MDYNPLGPKESDMTEAINHRSFTVSCLSSLFFLYVGKIVPEPFIGKIRFPY